MYITLDKRCEEILKTIIYTNGYMKVQDLADEMHVSKRSVYYDINKINEWLDSYNIPVLVQERGKGIHVSNQQVSLIQEKLFNQEGHEYISFTPEERYNIEICSVIVRKEPLYIENFMEMCDVSRNTIINDLKHVTKILKTYEVSLKYSMKEGYTMEGEAIRVRAVFFLLFPSLWEYYENQSISTFDRSLVMQHLASLKQIEHELHAEYVSGVLPSLAVFLSTIEMHSDKIEFNDMDEEEIQGTKEYTLVSEFFEELSDKEKLYVSLHLLGSRLQTVPVNVMKEDTKSYEIAQKLVKAFEQVSLMDYEHEDELVAAINAHLQTSMYRYRYGIQLGNPMLKSIQSEYAELFELTKQAYKSIQSDLGYIIGDDEIAYLTLHFGAFMTPKNKLEHTYRILIICPNGIGTGNMIKNEVASLVPQATEIQNIPLSSYTEDHTYDIVISTILLPKEKKLIMVHPILTDQDRVTILRKCMYNEPQVRMQIDDIVKIISKYIDPTMIANARKDLQDYYSTVRVHQAPQKDYGNGLSYYLRLSHIQIVKHSIDWESALRLSGAPLLMEDSITQDYINAIVSDQKEKHLHMFLTEELVLAHTGTEHGVKQVDVSITTFKEPVTFLNGKQARIIVTLCAEDQTKHLKILNDILELFSKKKSVDQIVRFNTPNDILDYIHSHISNDQL